MSAANNVTDQDKATARKEAEERRQALADRRQGELRLGLSFRPAEVGCDDERSASLEEKLQCRDRFANPCIVRDRTVLERHVEVGAHEYAASLDVEIRNAQLSHGKFMIIAQLPRQRGLH